MPLYCCPIPRARRSDVLPTTGEQIIITQSAQLFFHAVYVFTSKKTVLTQRAGPHVLLRLASQYINLGGCPLLLPNPKLPRCSSPPLSFSLLCIVPALSE